MCGAGDHLGAVGGTRFPRGRVEVHHYRRFGASGVAGGARTSRRGLPAGCDLAVVGFDSLPEAAFGAYRLTIFFQDPALIAARASGDSAAARTRSASTALSSPY